MRISQADAPHQIRQCEAAGCRLRFPVPAGSALGERCPHCGAATRRVGDPYQTHPVRTQTAPPGPPVEALLDNIRSLRNVGGIFRTADGAGVRHLHLGGFTPTPAHPQMAKTALGAEAAVPWTHHPDPLAAAETLAEAGFELWALEGGPRSEALGDALRHRAGAPLVLVLGHEVSGVDPRLVERCHRVVAIPMAGVKGSLNVGVAFGVAAYFVRHGA